MNSEKQTLRFVKENDKTMKTFNNQHLNNINTESSNSQDPILNL